MKKVLKIFVILLQCYLSILASAILLDHLNLNPQWLILSVALNITLGTILIEDEL